MTGLIPTSREAGASTGRYSRSVLAAICEALQGVRLSAEMRMRQELPPLEDALAASWRVTTGQLGLRRTIDDKSCQIVFYLVRHSQDIFGGELANDLAGIPVNNLELEWITLRLAAFDE